LKQTYKELTESTDYAPHFPKQASRSRKNTSISFVESSHRLPNLDLQHNGFELTCALRFCERANNICSPTTADRANSSAAG
jgi:hypothetical protein